MSHSVNLLSSPPVASYLANLNPEQQAAVEAVHGPVLVLAGAGTGKTRVLTTRIAHILNERHAWPSQILAVTFTNKAAREMSERVEKFVQSAECSVQSNSEPPTQHSALTTRHLPWLGTFHSIAAKILRRHAEAVGLTSTFTILDTDDQLRLLKAILAEKQIDEKTSPAKLFLAIIQNWKDQGLTPDKVGGGQGPQAQALQVYRAYQERLRSLNAVDFGDLLLHNLTLFTQHNEILADFAGRFRYILVDEYQDTNIAQYLWLRLLALGHKNICCVGDDDQSIYGWRGAEVGNILKFEKDFPGAVVVRLERNYRSTTHILSAASHLISHNKDRLGKTLWTESEGGEKIRLKSVWDDQEEARFIGEEVEALQRSKIPLNEMAILVRAGFQTRGFEERFMTLGIPYRVIGGLRFYERMEIRDAIAYLRVTLTPDDDLAFERIINTPKRGIGKATMEQLHTNARGQQISLYRATDLLLSRGELKGKLGAGLRAFLDHFARWRSLLSAIPLPELTEMILEESGYRAMWQQDKSPEAAGRLENLKELTRALGEFETLTDFLEHVGLVTESTTNAGSNSDMVSLMTLHAAKGLEFKAVFLPGWEEGLFPHQRALDESGQKGLEEERRLAYVGITRAREYLTITHAANRRIYNQWQSSLPSRFLGELPPADLELLDGGARLRRPTSFHELRGNIDEIMSGARLAVAPAGERASAAMHESTGKPYAAPFTPGTRIFHQKFGYGRVQSAQGNHLEIIFEKAGTKKVLADFVARA